ncbi:DUF805 domain-containing protein [Actinobacillus pleuropneumoniae]|uniref:DUF805 domain-containing protein n=1 Tax=Actinobacillus pleuropneumoniae TaxID=715 RepID=A0A9Q4H4Z2_ACTPL|nr:DUF805 domain-containing protein [Actinobacillus pleuropneumoniae]ASU15951.1 Inner membrane protein YhaI [Actinobacillus pleuropneumoniae]EFN01579.1 hypothetical protein appser12_590 [Actinobacillus pleuropneumoniae serovar 12 str. 1096]MCL7721053.1 DUF805 domain-containing protein [Actinobacillus pleuropneumoniae]MCL7728088.1 DUF805 domain-containing protein [Actinobacillus pleuropneumoniae]MCL7729857.1 DUF805 domain-containing protein [Actinobacillus pleuropneumoniae]
MNWFLLVLKKTFNFKDRARRREYGWFYLINILIVITFNILVSVCVAIGLEELGIGLNSLSYLYQLLTAVTAISLTARRLHDLGWSGWWQLLPYAVAVMFGIATIFSLEKELGGAITGTEYALYGSTVFGSIAVIVFSLLLLFKDGQRFSNKYGEDPKAVKNSNEVTNSLTV